MNMKRFVAVVNYKGSAYVGWQKQPHLDAVQTRLEYALGFVAHQAVSLTCAGRTDSGVHALYQVISFAITAKRTPMQLMRGAHSLLPPDIRVIDIVEADFNARFDACYREYVYVIDNHPVALSVLSGLCGHVPLPLDVERMHAAVQYLIGERDFQAFRSAQCQSNSSIRRMLYARVWQVDRFVYCLFRANAFLHRMVRNLVGSLVQIGLGKQPIHWLEELLITRQRSRAAAAFRPDGLYLSYVYYGQRSRLLPPQPAHFLF